MSTTASVIEASEEALMHDPADELVNNNNIRCKCNYLKDMPNKVHHYIQDSIREYDSECTIARNKVEISTCKSTDNVPDHNRLTYEMIICNSCKCNFFPHCNVSSIDNIDLCIRCYQNQNILGNSEIINVEKSTMIEEINRKCYGGGCTFISDSTLDKFQSMRKEIFIEGGLNNAFNKVKCTLDTWDNTFTSGKLKVIGAFNMYSESG